MNKPFRKYNVQMISGVFQGFSSVFWQLETEQVAEFWARRFIAPYKETMLPLVHKLFATKKVQILVLLNGNRLIRAHNKRFIINFVTGDANFFQ